MWVRLLGVEGRNGVRCPQCGATECISIEIHLATDDPLQFFSCRRCEARWWQRDGEPVSLEEVLSLAARKDPR
jgi:hypothetical protein